MEDEPAGIAVCFFGFSTFRARPLLNVHDLAVMPKYRRQGVGSALLRECENRALRAGCCKLTLEVQDDNLRARALYERFGFGDFVVAELGVHPFPQQVLELRGDGVLSARRCGTTRPRSGARAAATLRRARLHFWIMYSKKSVVTLYIN